MSFQRQSLSYRSLLFLITVLALLQAAGAVFGIGSARAAGDLTPDIKVNGRDGPLVITPTGLVAVTVSLDNNGTAQDADWWLAAETPIGTWFYVYGLAGWTQVPKPAYQGGIFHLQPFDILSAQASGLVSGHYRLYFGIDTLPDGEVTWDRLYYDTAEFEIEPGDGQGDATGKPVVLMTYNILNGAGVDELFQPNKDWAAAHGYPGNRLPQVLQIIKEIDPDILAVQEAHQWERGEPAVAERVAGELGMEYCLGRSVNPDSGYANVVLFTKYHILECENYGEHFTRAGMRGRLVMPSGEIVNVFVAHLDSFRTSVRQEEVRFLLGEMAPYMEEFTLFMGDMNFRDGWGDEGDILRDGGMYHAVGNYIDQIWASPALNGTVEEAEDRIPYELTVGASDHVPVVGVMSLSE